MTVLLGAEAASAHQNQARHGQLVRSRDYDMAQKEFLALRLVARVTRAFLDGGPPRGTVELADELGCPERTLEEVGPRSRTRASSPSPRRRPTPRPSSSRSTPASCASRTCSTP